MFFVRARLLRVFLFTSPLNLKKFSLEIPKCSLHFMFSQLYKYHAQLRHHRRRQIQQRSTIRTMPMLIRMSLQAMRQQSLPQPFQHSNQLLCSVQVAEMLSLLQRINSNHGKSSIDRFFCIRLSFSTFFHHGSDLSSYNSIEFQPKIESYQKQNVFRFFSLLHSVCAIIRSFVLFRSVHSFYVFNSVTQVCIGRVFN